MEKSRPGCGLIGNGVLAAVSVLFAFVAVESLYRFFRYHALLKLYVNQLTNYDELGTRINRKNGSPYRRDTWGASVFDPETGFRYRPHVWVEEPPKRANLSLHRWKTNSHGHIADYEYPMQKPSGEFRVAVIGDSFAAGSMNSVRWTSVLEEQLNRNKSRWLKKPMTRVRVINFGRDSISATQFQAVFAREARGFEPDAVVVSFIIEDILRNAFYRGRIPGTVESETELRRIIHEKVLRPLPWFGFYSEIVSVSFLGPLLGAAPHLNPAYSRFYQTDEEAVEKSLVALQAIRREHPMVLFLHHPMVEEFYELTGRMGQVTGEYRQYVDRLFAVRKKFYNSEGDLNVIRMIDFMTDSGDVTSLYQIPDDRHPSDAGMRIYGNAVATLLVDVLAK